uniref:Uncharacterized protein n=1 Tax=Sinocyclocheilus grahami TaxID=75366 RepID=A0A672PCU9_SINGR
MTEYLSLPRGVFQGGAEKGSCRWDFLFHGDSPLLYRLSPGPPPSAHLQKSSQVLLSTD